MNIQNTSSPSSRPLRLWPGLAAAGLLVLIRVVMPVIFPETAMFGVIGGIGGALVILAWWLFFSRAPWSERLGAIVMMVLALLATSLVVHPSISNGMMGMMLPVFATPLLTV